MSNSLVIWKHQQHLSHSFAHWSLDKNGWHFADDIFTCISMNQNYILIEISRKFVATCSSCNKSLLVQVMDWRWTVDNPLPNNDDRFHLLMYAPLCLNEITTRGLVPSCQYNKSHCGDKTILRPSYLHDGITYTDKMTFLYWINPQVYSD